MLAYPVRKICAVDGYGLLSVCVVYGSLSWNVVPRQLAIHHADRQQPTSIHCTDFTYNIRQHISSLRGIQELPEDGNKLPKIIGAQG
jgi:hypothetical protein